MDLFEAIHTRRSIRAFTDEPVSEADMDVMKLHEYQGAEGIAIDFFKPKEVEAGVEALPLR